MKVFFMVALAFALGFVLCLALVEVCVIKPALRAVPNDAEADPGQRVYLQAPGEVPKPEYPLHIVHVCRSKDDGARWRENMEVWRIYFAQEDVVLYLAARRGD